MPPAADQTNTDENELRVVVDAQIVLAMFLKRRDRPDAISPKRQLLKLLCQRFIGCELQIRERVNANQALESGLLFA
jgi:hypothetical protein